MKFKIVNIVNKEESKFIEDNIKMCSLCNEANLSLISLPCSHELCNECFNGYIKGKLEIRSLIPNFINFNTSQDSSSICSDFEYMNENLMIWCPFASIATLNDHVTVNQIDNTTNQIKDKAKAISKIELNFEKCISDKHINYEFIQNNVNSNVLDLYQKQARFMIREATPFEIPCYVCGKNCTQSTFLTECSKCNMTAETSTKLDIANNTSLKGVDFHDYKYCVNCSDQSDIEDCIK